MFSKKTKRVGEQGQGKGQEMLKTALLDSYYDILKLWDEIKRKYDYVISLDGDNEKNEC